MPHRRPHGLGPPGTPCRTAEHPAAETVCEQLEEGRNVGAGRRHRRRRDSGPRRRRTTCSVVRVPAETTPSAVATAARSQHLRCGQSRMDFVRHHRGYAHRCRVRLRRGRRRLQSHRRRRCLRGGCWVRRRRYAEPARQRHWLYRSPPVRPVWSTPRMHWRVTHSCPTDHRTWGSPCRGTPTGCQSLCAAPLAIRPTRSAHLNDQSRSLPLLPDPTCMGGFPSGGRGAAVEPQRVRSTYDTLRHRSIGCRAGG